VRARARFEHVLADNVSEIELNDGKVAFPSNCFRPLFSPNHVIGQVKHNCRYPTKLSANNKRYLLVDSSYTVGSDPNTMRDLAIFRGGPVNMHEAAEFSDPPEKPLSLVSDPSQLSEATPSERDATIKGKRLLHKMLNMRRLFAVQQESRIFSKMKKDQLDHMKQTGFASPVQDNA